jgi:Kef-type K+ transport system membrane component KefB
LGLVLYMFLVGAEFDLGLLRRHLHSAAAVSLAGILAPFALGCALAYFLAGNTAFFSPQVQVWEAMLFIGAAMSITAFPMLARIICERGLTGTALGTLTLAAGGVNDAAAWCILALVLASFSGDAAIALRALGGGLAYAALVWWVFMPWLKKLDQRLEATPWTLILVLLMGGAWFTDYVRIYAVFGAFVLGMAMPRGRCTEELQRGGAPLATYLLVPLFFVYSGLHTRLDLVASPDLWGLLLLVIALACLGKGVACWLAARLQGEGQRDALSIGVLMNARGMMELLLLNIGLEQGIITPTLFTLMVVMTIATTLMATPLFELIRRRAPQPI